MNGNTSLKLLLIAMIKNNLMVASYALKLNKNWTFNVLFE
jgi:hypothetical protein